MGNYAPLSEMDFGKKTATKRIVSATVLFDDGTFDSFTTVEDINDGQEDSCSPPCNPIIDPLCTC